MSGNGRVVAVGVISFFFVLALLSIVYYRRKKEVADVQKDEVKQKIDSLTASISSLEAKLKQAAPNRPVQVPFDVVPHRVGFYSSVRDKSPFWKPIGTMFSVDPKDDTVLTIMSRYMGYGPEYRVQNRDVDIALNVDRLYNGQKLLVPGLEGVGDFQVNNLRENVIVPLP